MNEIARLASKRTSSKAVRMPLKAALARFNASFPPIIYELQKFLPEGCWIGGGAIASYLTGQSPGDIDIWASSYEAADKLRDMLDSIPASFPTLATYKPHERTDPQRLGVTLVSPSGPPITLYDLAFLSGPEHIADSFDFTVCCFAIDGNDIVCHPQALSDLERRVLRVHRQTTAAYLRTMKYLGKGYSINPSDRPFIVSTHRNGEMYIGSAERRAQRVKQKGAR